MPRSEDEGHSQDTPADAELTDSRRMRFQCPADFVSFNYKPCSSTQNNSSSEELWLIRAPASFNPQSFSGMQLPLCGLETVSVPYEDETERLYNVLGSSSCHPELRLLAPPATLAPPFSGLISICESHNVHSGNQALHIVPAIPPPSVPSGLKQRFQHLQTTTVSTRCVHGEVAKKRKREKKIKSEPQQASERLLAVQTQTVIKTEIKDEPLDTGFGEQPEARKKKKKKKSKRAE